MPSGVADFGAEAWLQALFGVADVPGGYWVALCSDAPGPAADGDIVADLEPTAAANYQRQWIASGPDSWSVNGAYLANDTEVDWGLPFADWGRITHYALLDASSGGNLYAWGELSTPLYVTQAYLLTIPAGGLIVNLSSLVNPIVY